MYNIYFFLFKAGPASDINKIWSKKVDMFDSNFILNTLT
jgi:hypothetical protein